MGEIIRRYPARDLLGRYLLHWSIAPEGHDFFICGIIAFHGVEGHTLLDVADPFVCYLPEWSLGVDLCCMICRYLIDKVLFAFGRKDLPLPVYCYLLDPESSFVLVHIYLPLSHFRDIAFDKIIPGGDCMEIIMVTQETLAYWLQYLIVLSNADKRGLVPEDESEEN